MQIGCTAHAQLWFPALVMTVACSAPSDTPLADANDDGQGHADATHSTIDAMPPASDATVLAACTDREAQPVDSVRSLSTNDGQRSYRVHVPPSYDPAVRTPLVFNFHGLTMNAVTQEWYSRMLATSDTEGFVVVHPDGIGNSWNSGGCCGDAASQDIDDVGFVSGMLDELEAELCVDTKRVYATGMSNGGHMSNQLACALSHRFAAVAPVAGSNYSETCNVSRPVPMLHFHGTADAIVPYALGTTAVDAWIDRNGCSDVSETTVDNGEVECNTWNDCDAGVEVTLCTITGGGHTWPGGETIPGLGHVTEDIIANDAMWTFFQRFELP
jgi:polyhydroxybutyrate depolymerase